MKEEIRQIKGKNLKLTCNLTLGNRGDTNTAMCISLCHCHSVCVGKNLNNNSTSFVLIEEIKRKKERKERHPYDSKNGQPRLVYVSQKIR